MSTKSSKKDPSTSSLIDDDKDEGVTGPNEVALEQANDAATGLVASSESSGEPVELQRYGFDILANIKQAQLQNGLRHGDYQRYRTVSSVESTYRAQEWSIFLPRDY